jgi:hypothetical protein
MSEKIHSVDIEPDRGSHYLVINGVKAARFNELQKAMAARQMWIEDMAREAEQKAQEVVR